MKIVSKQIDKSNIVAVFNIQGGFLPDLQAVARLHQNSELANAEYIDDAVMRFRMLGVPLMKLRYVFESNRFRLEDDGARKPEDSLLASKAFQAIETLYPKNSVVTFGFNFDLVYRTDTVIPQKDVMKNFLKQDLVDDVFDFGWQFSLKSPKSDNRKLYFFKVVSPLEVAVHVNFHFVGNLPAKADILETEFEKCYDDIDEVMSQLVV